MSFAVTKKGETSALRKDIGHVIPHILYYFCALGALAKVIYNCSQPGITQEKIVAQFLSVMCILIVMWQCWPPLSMIRYTMKQRKAEKAAKEAAASRSPRLPASP